MRWFLLMVIIGCRVEIGPPERKLNTPTPLKPSGTVMIYTSMYRQVIDAVKPVLRQALPEVEVEWLQGGSEKLGTRLDAELAAGAPQADIVMTSDPLWYERLNREGYFLPYASIGALAMPREFVDPEGAFATTRISTMVIAYNERLVSPDQAPRSFETLFEDRWRGKVTMPDPLGSGTTFTTLCFLTNHYGLGIIDKMKAAQTVSSGGNTSTFTRIESGEHHVGFVLLENILKGRSRSDPVVNFVLPSEGAILIPGPISILKESANPKAAKAVYDVLLSREAQEKVVAGWMHSPLEKIPAPRGAPSLSELTSTKYQWTEAFIQDASQEGRALRAHFAKVMGGG